MTEGEPGLWGAKPHESRRLKFLSGGTIRSETLIVPTRTRSQVWQHEPDAPYVLLALQHVFKLAYRYARWGTYRLPFSLGHLSIHHQGPVNRNIIVRVHERKFITIKNRIFLVSLV